MSSAKIELYQDEPDARREVAAYLARSMDDALTAADWQCRFAHWWDANPWKELDPLRGWVLREGETLKGFLAMIPIAYAVHGEVHAGFTASTMAIDEDERHAALPMLMRLRQTGRDHLIADTTPSTEVQAVFDRTGWSPHRDVVGHYFTSLPGFRGRWPALPEGLAAITDPRGVKSLPQAFQHADRIEKWVTPESLRWQLGSPARDLHFLGAVRSSGELVAFMILASDRVRRVRGWHVVESWSSEADPLTLQALMGCLLRGETDLPTHPAIVARSFPSERVWDSAPAKLRRPQTVSHYFFLPKALKDLAKHTVPAEGDEWL